MQRAYETMIVLRADLPEAGVKEQLERLTKILETQGATVRGVHEWGLRELAYLVRKERRGFYALIEYTGEAAALLELERQMKLSDHVLRYVSVRQEHPVEVATPTEAESTTSTSTEPAAAPAGAATDTPSGASGEAPTTPEPVGAEAEPATDETTASESKV